MSHAAVFWPEPESIVLFNTPEAKNDLKIFAELSIRLGMSSRPQILFRPIVDTADHRIMAHDCDADGVVDAAIRAAAAQSKDGLYFIRPCRVNPRCYAIRETVRKSALLPGNIVFEVPVADIVENPKHWLGAYDAYRNAGFGMALVGAVTGPRSVRMIRDLRPDYVKLDRSLIRNVERLSCAMTIRGIADLADEWGGHVIADGVDRVLIVENLWLLNVYLMQGGLLGRPATQLARDDSPELANLAQALAFADAPAGMVRAAGAGGGYS